MTADREGVFSLGAARGPARLGLRALEAVLGLRRLGAAYARLPASSSAVEFLGLALDRLEVGCELDRAELERVPTSGPVVVVANHPYGGVEGMLLARTLLGSVRPDVRVMANYLLGRIPELAELFILVDPFGGADATRRNLAGLRAATRWLDRGGLLVVFPAGEVASLDLRRRRVVDPPWAEIVARLVRRARASVVPVFVGGHNGPLFQLAGLLDRRLRTALLARELLNRRGRTIAIRIGRPAPFARLAACRDDRELVDYLRRRCELLGLRERPGRGAVQPRRTPPSPAPLAPPVDPAALAAEVAALPASARLASAGGLEAVVAEADEIPELLREIGRLRETSFRAVGEGTGRELDLDVYDQRYRHLFLWQPERREVVGAYRIGSTRPVLAELGPNGLYTSTLFAFDRRLFAAMGPAFELGRSFVRPEYQRSFAALMLLWKGIGRLVLREPEVTTLFGPVSVSSAYHARSQELIVAFLQENRYAHPWSRWVRPRTPFRRRWRRAPIAHLHDLDDVSSFIAEIETDAKGVPVLLRQYLKLGGRLLGFNLDPAFSNVLDVLVMVDLRATEPRVLARYLGETDAVAFLGRHRQPAGDPSGGG